AHKNPFRISGAGHLVPGVGFNLPALGIVEKTTRTEATMRAPPASALLSITLAALAFSSTSAQTERRTLSGARVSIHNIVGRLRVQPGGGSTVVVDVPRSGRDANQLSLRASDIRGIATLRVLYPSDRIVYPELGFRSNTELRVNPDGTFDDNGGWR